MTLCETTQKKRRVKKDAEIRTGVHVSEQTNDRWGGDRNKKQNKMPCSNFPHLLKNMPVAESVTLGVNECVNV